MYGSLIIPTTSTRTAASMFATRPLSASGSPTEAPAALADLNGDGTADVRDATAFGDIWRGAGDATKAWQGHELPPKPE